MTSASSTLVVVGAGAAGLFAAIWAGRAARELGADWRIVLVDGARTLGAKILVAGGGRCNVTHHAVDERAYAGSSRNAIRQVLRSFGVEETIRFFAELGVELKQEETGKLFPVTDSARTVLEALLREARDAGVALLHPWRVERVERAAPEAKGAGFTLHSISGETLHADRLVLATGGLSLPKSGSDGLGHALARSLGHTITPHVFPALVPLLLPDGHPLRSVSGISSPATVEVRSASGKLIVAFTDAVLCTHFGLSGPAILDASRWWTEAHDDHPAATLVINWLPGERVESIEARILARRGATPSAGSASQPDRLAQARSAAQLVRARLPERLADLLLTIAAVDPATPLTQCSREERSRLAQTLCALRVPVVGDRGWTHAEVTAGGVPLSEVHLATMESRRCPGLYLCGEILDVDGRIGGFNFQWAWSSGAVAGTSSMAAAR